MEALQRVIMMKSRKSKICNRTWGLERADCRSGGYRECKGA